MDATDAANTGDKENDKNKKQVDENAINENQENATKVIPQMGSEDGSSILEKSGGSLRSQSGTLKVLLTMESLEVLKYPDKMTVKEMKR